MGYKNILLKLSGEQLAGKNGSGFDETVVGAVVRQVLTLIENGATVSVVIGGGNFWRGRDTKDGFSRETSDAMGMMAMTMNALFFADFLRKESGGRVKGVVMTPFTVGAWTELYNADAAAEHQRNGRIVVFAGGTGHPYFSSDMISVMRGKELNADAVLFAKPTDGLYDKDPKRFPDTAVKLPRLTFDEVLDRRLSALDLTATAFCAAQNPDKEEHIVERIIVFDFNAKDSIITAAGGNEAEILKIGSIVTLK